jgi:hypothetical protein
MKYYFISSLFLLVCLHFLTNSASAVTFVVTNTNNSGTGSLRQAVEDSNLTTEADEIVFERTIFGTAQTITLTSGEIIITQPLKIIGPGENLLRISGNNNSRVFFLSNTAVVSLGKITLTNGKAPISAQNGFSRYAGGIYIEGGQLYLSKVTVTDCSAEQAGGIYNREGTLHIVNSSITNNRATGGRNDGSYGGGINNFGALVISNSSINDNIAQGGESSSSTGGVGGGGGIYVYAGGVRITNSTIANNSVIGGNAPGSFGGNATAAGIYFGAFTDGITSGIISNTSFYNNNAVAGAGSSSSRAGRAAGGAIANLKPLELLNATISNNSVSSTNLANATGGGGIWNGCSQCLTITNSTVVGNNANSLAGGGILAVSVLSLRNTIIANNNAGFGPDVADFIVSLGNNLVRNGSGSNFVNGNNNDRVGTAAAPLDPLLSSLTNNGGATLTYLPLSGSPAIDNGNNCVLQSTSGGGCLANPIFTDQRGFVRLHPLGGTIDIGAVESGATAYSLKAPASPDLLTSYDTGISNTDNLTNALAPIFEVSGVPSGATVELLRNGAVVTSVYSTAGGTVLLSDAPDADGVFTYTSRIIVAGAVSFVSNPLLVTFETVRPTVTVNQANGQADPTDIQPINFIAEFSEPVYGVNTSAISFAGSTANTNSAIVTVSSIGSGGNQFLISVSNLTSTGQVRVSFLPNIVTDAAGNLNLSSTSIDNTVNFNLLIEVMVSGRVSSNTGVIKSIAFVTLTDNQTGATYRTITNPFGYFRFKQVVTYQQTGRTFVLDVRHKNFTITGQSFFINSNRNDVIVNIP